MKKLLFTLLAIVMAYGLALPMGPASGAVMNVVSDDSGDTLITKVYNKAGGAQTTVTPATPLTPFRAQEPDPYGDGTNGTYQSEYPGPYEATGSTWDGVNWFEVNSSTADWIWETETADGPSAYDSGDALYDLNAAKWGRALLMQATFNIPGNPIGTCTVHIACDNGYEVWVNGGTHYLSGSVGGPGWELTNLKQINLNTSGWNTVGHHSVTVDLVSGSNTLYVLAGNEYADTDDGDPRIGTMLSNPGAVIFQLDVEYEEIEADPGITVTKSADVDFVHHGDTITYTYEVENTGNVPLTLNKSTGVVDNDLSVTIAYVSGDGDVVDVLDDGETWVFEATYDVPAHDESEDNPIIDTATATAYYDTTPVGDTSDEVSVLILHPAIEVVKSADTHFAAPGETVYYSYVVNNIGDCVLYDVVLDDDVVGLIALTGLTDEDADTYDDDLAIGASATAGPVAYVIPGDAPESLTNIATASGFDEIGGEVTDDDQWTVVTMASRSMGYWKNHPDDWCILPPEVLMSYLPGRDAEEDGMNPLEMLGAQLIAAFLNVSCFDSLFDYNRYEGELCGYDTIYDVIEAAAVFLGANSPESWPTGKKDQRDFRKDNADELALKDCLEAFNTMGDEYWE